MRLQFPRWGKDKLAVLLRQKQPVSISMVGRILTQLKRQGRLVELLPSRTPRSRPVPRPRPYAVRKPKQYAVSQPGDIVQVDTLDVRSVPGVVLKKFTARDLISRWDVIQAHTRATAATATQFFATLQHRMPFPVRALQADGGSEFTAEFEQPCQLRGLHLFVLPPRSPRSPKLNGAVERANRTHTEEFYQITPLLPGNDKTQPGAASLGKYLQYSPPSPVPRLVDSSPVPAPALISTKGMKTVSHLLDEYRDLHQAAMICIVIGDLRVASATFSYWYHLSWPPISRFIEREGVVTGERVYYGAILQIKREIPPKLVRTRLPVLLEQSEVNTCEREIPISDLRWYFWFFVVSGFCGLVYEVVWLRLAMASFGVTTALVSIVISMFMAGLGLGSWGGGVLTRGVLGADRPRALRFYSIAELLVGISSLAVSLQLKLGRLLLQHMGSFGAWQTSRYYLLAGLWVAITLVPWCTCMGSTFPLLMAVIRQTAWPTSERSFSYLYVANVLGALLGTFASAFILIELLGFQGTLYVAGSLNAILALLAFGISFRMVSSPSIEKSISGKATGPRLYGLPRNTVLLLLFTTGLVSMGMEVVWIRQFTPYLGNVVYAFAGIVAAYLLATFMGSQDYRSWAYSHQPDESASAWSLLALFAVIPVAAADPLRLLRVGSVDLDGMRVSSIVFFCALAGFLTPLLVDCWSSGEPDRAGTAYAVNVAGCIVGPLVTGFWLLPWLGERGALIVLAIPLFGIAALTAFRGSSSETVQGKSALGTKLRFAVATIAAILLFRISHDYETKYPLREVRRDYTATVIATGKGFDRNLLVNGVGMTSLTPMTKYMAHLPLAFMSRSPRNGLVICFGMGTTFRSMLSWEIPTTAVDLVPSVPALFRYFHADAPKSVSSPLARIVIDDGRRFLDGSTETYDVIVVDPPPPPAAPGSSLLYSRDFYEVVKRHLRRDGILQVWYPSESGDAATAVSVTKALMESFTYVRAFQSLDAYGIHFLASMEPLPMTSSSVLAARLPSAAVSDFVEWGPQANPQQQFELVISHELALEKLLAQDPRAPAMRDDQPINEYYLLRTWFHSYR